MKRLSIKMRVTLWYTLFLLSVVIFVLIYMVVTGQAAVNSDSRNRMTKVMEDNLDEIEYDDGELDIDDDFSYFKEGVYTQVYTVNQELIRGMAPEGFEAPPFDVDGTMKQIRSGSSQFFVYDRLLQFKHGESLWLRSILSVSSDSGFVNAMIRSAFVLLPLLVVAAAVGGYRITRRAFLPVEKITQAAEAINDGKDLSKRIELPTRIDEIYILADTINHMLTRLEKSFEAEKQFASDASHELRTPVAVIKSNCEYALKHALTVEDSHDSLETIQRQAEKMTRIIATLLTMTRMDQGTAKLEIEDTDLTELVQIICEEQKNVHAKTMTLTADLQEHIVYPADRSLFTRMVSNLIENAYQYGRENGHIYVGLRRADQFLELTVIDDGIGIKNEDQEKIWQRFYQADPARANANGSLGLGLSMVKQIAAAHHGTIELNSQPGKGTIFTLKFPYIS